MILISAFMFIESIHALNAADYPPYRKVPAINSAWTSAVMANKPSSDSSADYTACQRSNQWAITYDDGPRPVTNTVLGELSSRNIKATFFVVGSEVVTNPDILIAEYQQGHEIAIHTWSHSDLTTLTNDQIVAEIVWTAKAIYDSIGVVPTMIRPPYQSIDARVRAVLKNMGLSVVLWNRDTFDWTFSQSPPFSAIGSPWNANSVLSDIPRLVTSWVNSPQIGTITLQHDHIYLTTAQVPIILDTLLSSRFSLVKVSECIGGISPYGNQVLENLLSIGTPPPPLIITVAPPAIHSALVTISTNLVIPPSNTEVIITVSTEYQPTAVSTILISDDFKATSTSTLKAIAEPSISPFADTNSGCLSNGGAFFGILFLSCVFI